MSKVPSLTEVEARVDALLYHTKEATKHWRPVDARRSQNAANKARHNLSKALHRVFAALEKKQ